MRAAVGPRTVRGGLQSLRQYAIDDLRVDQVRARNRDASVM